MEKKVHGYCALCISRCGSVATVVDGQLTKVEPDPDHPTGQSFCIKGKAAAEIIYHPERILSPLKRTKPKGSSDPGWCRISWEEALTTISDKVREASATAGKESVCFGVTTPSGTGISDSFTLINRLAHAFGSPNTLFATENCNWHKDFAPKITVGDSIGMPDYANSGCIILWGFNPVTSWLAQAELINSAKKRGAKLIVIDPRKVGLANKADEWLPIKPATDGELAMALAHQLIINNGFDKPFIQQHSNGPMLVDEDSGQLLTGTDFNQDKNLLFAWDKQLNQLVSYDPPTRRYHPWPHQAGKKSLDNQEGLALFGQFKVKTANATVNCVPAFQLYAENCSQFTPEVAEKITGIPSAQIIATAQLIANSSPVSYFTWTGTAQQYHATQTGRAMALLYALTGDIDSRGGNVYFTKPAIANLFGLELLSPEQRTKTLGIKSRPLGPATMGWVTSKDLYNSIENEAPYPTKALLSFGSNPLLTKPDEKQARQALQKLEFYLHIDLFHNETSQYADIILPSCSVWERPGFYPGFQISQQAESLLQLRLAVIEPLGESKSDSWIVFELAKRLELGHKMFDCDAKKAFDALLKPLNLTENQQQQLLNNPKGIDLKLETSYQKHIRNGFATPSGRVEIFSSTFANHNYAPIPAFETKFDVKEHYPLALTSAKVIQFCHSQQRNIASLTKRQPVPLAEINPETAARFSITDKDWIVISSGEGEMEAQCKLSNKIKPNVVCCQYGWPAGDQHYSKNYNSLIPSATFDPISSSNGLRHAECAIRPA